MRGLVLPIAHNIEEAVMWPPGRMRSHMQRATAAISVLTLLLARTRADGVHEVRLAYGVVEVRHLLTAAFQRRYNAGLATAVPIVLVGIQEFRRRPPARTHALELARLGFGALLLSHLVAIGVGAATARNR